MGTRESGPTDTRHQLRFVINSDGSCAVENRNLVECKGRPLPIRNPQLVREVRGALNTQHSRRVDYDEIDFLRRNETPGCEDTQGGHSR
jgi:hypothetical protein